MFYNSIFSNSIELDCFCMDIADAWIKDCKNEREKVSSDRFMEWVMNEFVPALEYNFDDIYEENFGHREYN